MGWVAPSGWFAGKQDINRWRMRTKRRALVLFDESAHHPFLRSLPPHVRKQSPAQPGRTRIGRDDWRSFLAAYCAAFLVVSIFIA